jgi:hypothetical protein
MNTRVFTLAACLSLLSACAATSPPPATSTPTTVASVGAPAEGVTDAQQQQFIKMASRLGYHVEMVGSERHYCHSHEMTESHLPKKECINENQMAARIKSGKEEEKNVLTQSSATTGGVITRSTLGRSPQ